MTKMKCDCMVVYHLTWGTVIEIQDQSLLPSIKIIVSTVNLKISNVKISKQILEWIYGKLFNNYVYGVELRINGGNTLQNDNGNASQLFIHKNFSHLLCNFTIPLSCRFNSKIKLKI